MPPPIISRLSPSAGWPGGVDAGGSPVLWTQVIIHGRHFNPTPEMNRNQVTFTGTTGGRVPAPVVWASVNEIDYQPNGIVARDSTVPSGLDNPRGIAIDAAGNIYIADTENHRIVKRSSTGSFISWGSSRDRGMDSSIDLRAFALIVRTIYTSRILLTTEFRNSIRTVLLLVSGDLLALD